MGRSRLRDALTHWRTWADVGALLFLGWFLVLLVRPQLTRRLQSYLLANRGLLPLLPHGIASPRVLVSALTSLGIPLAVVCLLATLLLVAPSDETREGDGEPHPEDDQPRDEDRQRGE